MCKVPVAFLDCSGNETSRGEIEICDFSEKEHRFLGKSIHVIVPYRVFKAKASDCIKALIGSGLNGHFDKAVLAIDPGEEYPVYRLEIGAEKNFRYWIPKSLCSPAPGRIQDETELMASLSAA